MNRFPFLIQIAAAAISFHSATAATFHPISAVEVNMVSGNAGGNPVTNIAEGIGIGFDADEPHAGPSGVWYTDAPGGFPSDYINVHDGPEYIWFDLGADALLAEISFWGYSATNSNGMREFNLSFATDAEGGDVALGDENYGSSITANPAFAALQDPTPRQSFQFDAVTARYVRVEATSTFFEQPGAGAGGDRLGIGEIAFEMISEDPTISVPADVELQLSAAIETFDVPIANRGNQELIISDYTFIGDNAAAFGIATAPASIPAVSSDIIEIQFDPAGLLGPVTATLQITSNDPNTPVAEIVFTGTVPATEQDIRVNDPTIDRTVDAIKTFDLPVGNAGGTDLVISGTSLTGSSAFSVISAPATIAAQGSENIQIQIDPTGLEGLISATLQIISDDPDSPTTDVLIEAVALGDAAEFFPITSVASSTAANDFYPVENLIQGPDNGFGSATPYTKLADGAGGLWVTAACGFPCDFIETTEMPTLTFDLGQNVPLGEISLWGYSATNSNGVSEFSLRFATDSDGPDGFGNSITYNPIFGGIDSGEFPNEDAASRFSFPFQQSAFTRYVELTCVDNYFIAPGNGSGGEIPGGDRVGLGEVAFAMLAAPGGAGFAITRITRNSPTEIEIEFNSSAGTTYAIDRSTDLSDWGNELDDGVSGQQDSTVYVDDSVPADSTEIFYRVRRL